MVEGDPQPSRIGRVIHRCHPHGTAQDQHRHREWHASEAWIRARLDQVIAGHQELQHGTYVATLDVRLRTARNDLCGPAAERCWLTYVNRQSWSTAMKASVILSRMVRACSPAWRDLGLRPLLLADVAEHEHAADRLTPL